VTRDVGDVNLPAYRLAITFILLQTGKIIDPLVETSNTVKRPATTTTTSVSLSVHSQLCGRMATAIASNSWSRAVSKLMVYGLQTILLSHNIPLTFPVATRVPNYTAWSTSMSALIIAMTLLAAGDRTFYVAAARTWNSLPFGLTSASSLSTFRRQLKTLLFTRSYPDSFHLT